MKEPVCPPPPKKTDILNGHLDSHLDELIVSHLDEQDQKCGHLENRLIFKVDKGPIQSSPDP